MPPQRGVSDRRKHKPAAFFMLVFVGGHSIEPRRYAGLACDVTTSCFASFVPSW
jgi:hypothetical protein